MTSTNPKIPDSIDDTRATSSARHPQIESATKAPPTGAPAPTGPHWEWQRLVLFLIVAAAMIGATVLAYNFL